MLSKRYSDMLSRKDIIFEIAGYGRRRAQEIGPENVFDFSLGNPSVDAPPCVNETIQDVLARHPSLEVHGYGPGQGIASVRQAVARSLNHRFSMDYGPEHIFMTAGAAGALAHALRAVTQPGDELILFAPFFSEYFPYAEGAGLTPKIVPPDTAAFQIDFPALERLLNPKVTAVLINSPNNPTGAVLSTQTLKQLAALLEERQRQYHHPIYLISDEPYREIVYHGDKAEWLPHIYRDTIVCYSFSKSLSLPGERLGYVLVPEEVTGSADIYAAVAGAGRSLGYVNAPSLFQQVVSLCCDMTSDIKVYEENAQLLVSSLREMGYHVVEPSGAFYLFPRTLIPDDVAFCERAKEFDLLIVPGSGFGAPGHTRISYCVQTDVIRRALPRFKELADSYR